MSRLRGANPLADRDRTRVPRVAGVSCLCRNYRGCTLLVVAEHPQRLLGIRVLVVEDHQDTRDIYTHVLEAAGAVVESTKSAQDAVPLLHTADVVVTDVAMPGEDGVWLLEQVPALPRHVPVVAVTGYVREQDPRLANAAFDLLLLKPVDPWRLCDEIESLVRRTRAAA
jgi:CheY-like chemotaxis protein